MTATGGGSPDGSGPDEGPGEGPLSGSPARGPGGEAYELVKEAVDGIVAQNEPARRAYRAMRDRGMGEEEAREEIARVLIAVTFHVGQETERLEAAGGGAGLREEAFRRLAEGETAEEVFGS